MITLFIDTTNNTKVVVILTINGIVYKQEETVQMRSSQRVLPMVDELLHVHKITPKDITAIEVNEGPGSYTGVRVGIAIGNAFAFALGIPINEKRIIQGKSSVEPKY